MTDSCCPHATSFMVKVCGITRVEDALLALQCGANAIGLNLYPPSSRYIEPEPALRIIEELPEETLIFGIVVAGRSRALEVPGPLLARLKGIQVHGISHEGEIPDFDRRVLVAVTPEDLDRFPGHEVIVDVSWGSGKRADWALLENAHRPYVLSGGLNSTNVGEALRRLAPAGVDVCSGVEAVPGRKDPLKLREFLRAVALFRETASCTSDL